MLTLINNAKVHYDLVGDRGNPVVLLVHALMADGSLWSGQVPALLKAGYQVLRLDLPGHGGSGARSAPCSMADLANDVVLLLDHLDIKRVHFGGISIGGMLGQALAIHHPGRVASLFLSDTTCAAPPTAREMWSARLKTVAEAGSLEPLADVTMTRVLSPSFKESHPALWQGLRDTIVGVLPAGLTQCAHALQEFNVVNLLPRIQAPTLVACGDGDIATPPAEAQRIASLIPGARYVEIAQALHYPNVEQDARFNEVLVEWLGLQQNA
jgi:3-oxoadipate enol-lactonase